MKFGLKNDDGIELHLSKAEREELYKILRVCSAYGEEKHVLEHIGFICELMNVLYSSCKSE